MDRCSSGLIADGGGNGGDAVITTFTVALYLSHLLLPVKETTSASSDAPALYTVESDDQSQSGSHCLNNLQLTRSQPLVPRMNLQIPEAEVQGVRRKVKLWIQI
ncbi:unnamed protein product [Pleuronectes platessa]|uniref:Uncharacterized protein n=1 Tax=Pleuronectes platessa TaxID=8262 RepID=A0A9N7ZB20_PLEPL|nr:unnamed protein product [Pleuronectes platessa]